MFKFAAKTHREGAVEPTMVLVRFPQVHQPLSYYNDRFQVKVRDIVFVEGKLAGVPGRVEKVTSQFHVDPEAFKKILGVADTRVRGTFHQAGSHLVAFPAADLPYRQVLSWHKAEEERYYIQYDEKPFSLGETGTWPFSREVLGRGIDYYGENRVVYLSLDGEQGRAIVAGKEGYEVSFRYADRQLSAMTCSCPCAFPCKHEAAALLQLRDTLDIIGTKYAGMHRAAGSFAAVSRADFFTYAVNGNEGAALRLEEESSRDTNR